VAINDVLPLKVVRRYATANRNVLGAPQTPCDPISMVA